MKKESAKRGYMTSEDIQEHLKKVEYAGDKYLNKNPKKDLTSSKIQYLQRVLDKERLLAPKTRQAVYEELGKLHEKEFDYDKAGQAYLKADDVDSALTAYQRARNETVKAIEKTEARRNQKPVADYVPNWMPSKIKYWLQGVLTSDSTRAKNKAVRRISARGLPYLRQKVGYYESEIAQLKRQKRSETYNAGGLEQKTSISATAAIITTSSTIAGLFFLSPNITGNAINNVTINSTNITGTALLIVGLIASFFWLKTKN